MRKQTSGSKRNLSLFKKGLSPKTRVKRLLTKPQFSGLMIVLLILGVGITALQIKSPHVAQQYAQTLPTANPIATPVLPTTASVTLTSCPGSISQSGNYILSQDITQPSYMTTPCIGFSNVSGVSLDCQNHTIVQGYESVVAVSTLASGTVSNLVIKNCTFSGSALAISSVDTALITNNTINLPESGNTLNVGISKNVTVTNNTITNGEFYESHSSYVDFSNNTVRADTLYQHATGSGVAEVSYSDHNNITNNKLDGMWGGANPGVGQPTSDDGIMLINSSNDYIYHNTIQNVWDTGIETEGQVTSEQILNNTITNAGYSGIGGWYQNSWLNNLVQGNIVSNAKLLFQFYLNTQRLILSPNPSTYYFQGNQFIGNTFASGTPSNSNSTNMNFQDLSQAPGVTPVLGNNILQDNDFGTFDTGPNLLPQAMIVDGGGNKCAANPFNRLPIDCGTATPSATIMPTTTIAPTNTPTPTVTPTLLPTATPTLTPSPSPIPLPPTAPSVTKNVSCISTPVTGTNTITISWADPNVSWVNIGLDQNNSTYYDKFVNGVVTTQGPVGFIGASSPVLSQPLTLSPNTTYYATVWDGQTNSISSPTAFSIPQCPDTTPPSVTITYPSNNGSVSRGSSLTVTMNASDNIGVTKVNVYANGSLVCSATNAPYSCGFSVSNRKNVSYKIQAKAYDAAGNIGTSIAVNVKTR